VAAHTGAVGIGDAPVDGHCGGFARARELDRRLGIERPGMCQVEIRYLGRKRVGIGETRARVLGREPGDAAGLADGPAQRLGEIGSARGALVYRSTPSHHPASRWY
jgi:hypothetical protein